MKGGGREGVENLGEWRGKGDSLDTERLLAGIEFLPKRVARVQDPNLYLEPKFLRCQLMLTHPLSLQPNTRARTRCPPFSYSLSLSLFFSLFPTPSLSFSLISLSLSLPFSLSLFLSLCHSLSLSLSLFSLSILLSLSLSLSLSLLLSLSLFPLALPRLLPFPPHSCLHREGREAAPTQAMFDSSFLRVSARLRVSVDLSQQ